MIPYLKGLPGSMIDKTRLKQYLTAVPVTCEMPREVFDWLDFIKAVKTFMGKNFLEFVMLLSGGLSTLHYQKVLSVVGEYTMKLQLSQIQSNPSFIVFTPIQLAACKNVIYRFGFIFNKLGQ